MRFGAKHLVLENFPTQFDEISHIAQQFKIGDVFSLVSTNREAAVEVWGKRFVEKNGAADDKAVTNYEVMFQERFDQLPYLESELVATGVGRVHPLSIGTNTTAQEILEKALASMRAE